MAATHTTNLNLNKPDRQDYVSVVTDINDNMDILDSKIGAVPSGETVEGQIGAKVPTTRKINNKALSSDVTIMGSDIPMNSLDNTKLDVAVGDLKSAMNYSYEGLEIMSQYATFQRGTLENGTVLSYIQYRVATNDITTFDRDITLTIAEGFRIAVDFFTDGTRTSQSGWVENKYTIYKNTHFKMMIARTTEDTTEVANVGVFVGKVTFLSELGLSMKDTETLNNVTFIPAELPQPESAWIRYSNGEKVSSSTTDLYIFKSHLPKYIKAFLTSDTNVLCAIAFYNSDDVSTDGYMQSYSVDFNNGTHNDGLWYETSVPVGCKTIAITTKKPSDLISTQQILFPAFTEMVRNISRINSQTQSPFKNGFCFGHLFVNQTSASFSSPILIPCQSIFDIQVTARLGFKYIEANVHKTQDGKYVVTHGLSGKLGNDFETTEGGQASDVVIADTTFSDLRTNYRYRSSYSKYKIPITSLEEFCYECKRWGMSVVLQYVDYDELNIARGILGDNIILYNGTRDVWDGYIMEYLGLSTKADIVNRCKLMGKPYMYNMSNPQSFTGNQLKDIITAVHETGCLIGFTGAYQSRNLIPKYIDYGFDFNASGLQVNDFDTGNLWNLNGDIDFSQITHTGTVTNGVLHLADGQYIRISDTENFLTKISMHIEFEGRLYVDGVGSGIYIESDGKNSMVDSRFYLNTTPTYRWDSSGDTYIKSISIRASKC